ncbi:DUF3179 domain-containing protein [Vibrio parahaemolyticus]|uniref:DUF3179 domain-containing protein n=1 Tax=Vibrio mediterranei TaxID=689 RepID=UPI004068068B
MSYGCRQLWFWVLFLTPITSLAITLNGFNLDNASVPQSLIQRGGPPRDGIPAIDNPKFVSAAAASYLHSDDIVLGLNVDGVAKAYPLRILNWHEIVNDRIGDTYYLISYCPLCGSGMAFESFSDDARQTNFSFGVSGLLYNSDVLMYDRATESLWSQIHGEAISGPHVGRKLKQVPLTLIRWSGWAERHPDSLVLSVDTGFRRNYNQDPYAGYAKNAALYFPVANQAPDLYHPKEMVMGVKVKQSFIAFPFSELTKQSRPQFNIDIENTQYTVHWDAENQSAWITDDERKVVPSTMLFWFAWYAFYPDTEIYRAQ